MQEAGTAMAPAEPSQCAPGSKAFWLRAIETIESAFHKGWCAVPVKRGLAFMA